jgi:hypothetical protein
MEDISHFAQRVVSKTIETWEAEEVGRKYYFLSDFPIIIVTHSEVNSIIFPRVGH